MKITMYMAVTANGMIATDKDNTPWSDKEFESFHSIVRKKKNIVVGRRTYELMKDDLKKSGNPFTVVLTRHKIADKNNTVFVPSPIKAIIAMKSKGFDDLLLAGGTQTNSAFIKAGLVDEIILDIEPFIFSKGINLVSGLGKDVRLKLLHAKKISNQEMQLHYKVLI